MIELEDKTVFTNYQVKNENCGNSTVDFAVSELNKYLGIMLSIGQKNEGSNNGSDCTNDKGSSCTNDKGCGCLDNDSLSNAEIVVGFGKDFFSAYNIDEKLVFDGYIIKSEKRRIVIASNYPRGVLFGVYHLLAYNGCKFVKASGISERIPKLCCISAPKLAVENPDYEVRGLTNMGTDVIEQWADETIDFVDWCAKNMLNTVFLHESMQDNFDGANGRVVNEIVRRGMMLEFGGHGTQNFVDKALFSTHPEYFIEKNGNRQSSGNLCISEKNAVKLVIDETRKFLEHNQHIDVLHLWFEDVLGGSWCECEKCKNKTPIEQLYYLVLQISQGIKDEFPNVKLDLLLYHDTLTNIKQLSNIGENIIAEFAPRERCYAHALDDPNCELNREYLAHLKNTVDVFGGENISVFEYYMDNILFSKNKCVIPKVIAGDLRAYKSASVTQICPLTFGLYSFWAYDINFYVYAKHVFHTDRDIEKTLDEYCEDFGLPQTHRKYIELLEKYSTSYLSFCGYHNNSCDIRGLPLCDYFPKHIEKIKLATAYLSMANDYIASEKLDESLAEFVRWEKKILEITLLESRGILQRMTVRYKNYSHSADSKDTLVTQLKEVQTSLYKLIDIIGTVPESIKGVQGGRLFVEHLCKDQIWTANELMSKELQLEVNLDRSII